MGTLEIRNFMIMKPKTMMLVPLETWNEILQL
jgi:hypothetical protein